VYTHLYKSLLVLTPRLHLRVPENHHGASERGGGPKGLRVEQHWAAFAGFGNWASEGGNERRNCELRIYMYMYICVYVYIYMCVCVRVCVWLCTSVYCVHWASAGGNERRNYEFRIYVCIYIYIYIYVHGCIYAYKYICMYVHIFSIHVYVYIGGAATAHFGHWASEGGNERWNCESRLCIYVFIYMSMDLYI